MPTEKHTVSTPLKGLGQLINQLSDYEKRNLIAFTGRKVSGVWTIGDHTNVAFSFDDGSTIYANPEGDCCSCSWVEHVSGVCESIGEEIISVNTRPELATHEGVDDSEYECLALYGITLITAGGHRIDIDYRNESNGYYGGWLNWDHRENDTPKDEWKRIWEDF